MVDLLSTLLARAPMLAAHPMVPLLGVTPGVPRDAVGTRLAIPFELGGAIAMPEKSTIERAEKDRRAGKAPSTQAGEFVREEMHHIREGKHGVRSTKQAIAIGLSKARRRGVKLPPPKRGAASQEIREKSARDRRRARSPKKGVSRTRSRATRRALEREGRTAASPKALARQAKSVAKRRGRAARSASARKAARTRARRRK